MRIGVNAFPLRVATGGARHLFDGLMAALLESDRQDEYVVFSHPAAVPRQLSGDRVRHVRVIDEERIYRHRDDFDLYFGPLNNLRPRLYDRPTVAMLDDLQHEFFPQYFSRAELLARREAYPEICRAATTVITVSEFCKQCMIEKLGVDPRRVEVVPNAPQAGIAASESGSWHGPPLPPFYFFYPANFHPHKNHALLLDAARSGIEGPSFVFTGMDVPGGFPLRAEIHRRGLADRCAVFSGLPAAAMRHLYQNAVATVLPTMFEGFGMPAVEALACGCPLVCSDIPALREVAAENALYFQAGNIAQLRAQLQRVKSDREVRGRLIEGGRARAGWFTWPAAARRVREIFAETAARFHSCPTPRPRVGLFVRSAGQNSSLARTIQSIAAAGQDVTVRVLGAKPPAAMNILFDSVASPDADDLSVMLDLASRHNLDLVGQVLEGNCLLPSALDSLAASWASSPARAVHLGEVAVWRGGRYAGVAWMRLTGDDLWKLNGELYPEMLFLAPAALKRWNIGRAAANWRWELIRRARAEDQLALPRRTFADCQRQGLTARLAAWRSGVLDFYSCRDASRVKVPLLRRWESAARLCSQFLPPRLQHAGAKWWHRIAR